MWRRRVTAVVTGVLHVGVLWLYISSGLVAPAWAVVALLLLWVALAWAAVVVHRRYGALALLVPVLAVVLWVAVLTLGERLLGWTA